MIKKIIVLVMFVTLSIQVVACQFSADELQACNQAVQEKLALTQPYSGWVQALCTKEGHIIKATKGYQWSANQNNYVYLNETGEIQTLDENGNYQGGMDLEIAYGDLEKIDYVVKNYNDFLQELKPDAPQYDEVHSLGFRGDMPFTYDLFILAKNAHPEYIIVCKEQCHVGDPVLIEVGQVNR